MGTTLAAVAQVTKTLRVGPLVIANDFRHPAVLAKEVTTLDQLSGGRVELGLGAGFLREEDHRAGLPFDSNSVRVDRLEEALPVLDKLLRSESVTYRGEHYQLDGFVNFPAAVQQPRPPILVGGGGPRMLSLAARCADTVTLLPASLHTGSLTDSPQARSLANVTRQIAQVREAAGPRFDDLELCLIGTIASGSDREEAARSFAAQRGWQVAPEAVLDMPSVLVGDTEAALDHMEQVRAETGVSHLVVRDSQLNLLAPLLERIKR